MSSVPHAALSANGLPIVLKAEVLAPLSTTNSMQEVVGADDGVGVAMGVEVFE